MSSQRSEDIRPDTGVFADYDPGAFFCELLNQDTGPNSHAAQLRKRLDAIPADVLRERARDAELELYNFGITFTVYTHKDVIDRILPFDVIPRMIEAAEWTHIERGVCQRVAALNRFLHDIYHDRHIIRDGIVPADVIFTNSNYRPEMEGLEVPCGTYVHINGSDLVRGEDGVFRVLEDNGRCPSGVSYLVENRHLMLRTFPDLMDDLPIQPVSNYGQRLREALAETAPAGVDDPTIVLMSPGTYNSAYFEHIFLAREMGVALVEGRDLVVNDDRVWMRTIRGLEPVHVIYRRINDEFLDPRAFDPDSLLGVPGLMQSYRLGHVTLANAVGTGVADDKAVYAYMPRIIRYYLDEEPLLPNVPTNLCREAEGLQYTLDHLDELVVKPVGEAGGYGITVGPHATREELDSCRRQILDRPHNWISQPMINLSVAPTLIDSQVEPRHVDLRTFAVTGADTWVLPGGLSRVALRRGSLIVNSSQGGGSKDTWVLQETAGGESAS